MSWITLLNAGILRRSDRFGVLLLPSKLKKAIEKGYRILQIHEIWNFGKTSSNLFSEYVNYFFRIKQESSRFPEWVQTPEDQAKYVEDYYKHEGILLRMNKIIESRTEGFCQIMFK